MHAAVSRVRIEDRGQAEKFLKEDVLPRLKQAPGFVGGYWVNLGDRGTSIVVFESEQAATDAMSGAISPPEGTVTIESMDVGEVVAHA